MTTDKRGISALLLQRQLGLRRYETAWMLLHKLRRAMVNATREPLHGDVEIDDTWVGGPQSGLRSSRQLKNRKAAIVVVAVENCGGVSGRVRIGRIPNFKQTAMIDFVKHHVSPGSTVATDGLKGFQDLRAAGVKHLRSVARLFERTPHHPKPQRRGYRRLAGYDSGCLRRRSVRRVSDPARCTDGRD